MPAFLLIGLGGGLASAVLFASAASGGPGRLLLYVLAPLPSFLAGLGWGSASAGIAALSGALGVGLALGMKAALMFFLTQGAPVAVICYLALLSRTVPAGPDAPGGAGVEWYPPGRLVMTAALIAGALATLSLLVLGPDLEALRKILRDLIENVFLKEIPGLKERNLSADDITAITEFALYALPAASAMTWLAGFLLNLWLGGRITLASGRLVRPWPDLPSLALPRSLALALAGAFALVLTSGYPALVGSAFAGALFLGYVLMGLAVVHDVTRGRASRPFVLWGVYLALLVLNTWAALAIALLALLEPFLPLRRSGPQAPD